MHAEPFTADGKLLLHAAAFVPVLLRIYRELIAINEYSWKASLKNPWLPPCRKPGEGSFHFRVNNNSGFALAMSNRYSPSSGCLRADGAVVRHAQRRAWAIGFPCTRCCGTRVAAAHASSLASGPRLWTVTTHENVLGRRLGVFDENIKIAIVVEHACVQQLELRLVLAAAGFSSTSRCVRKFLLRIFVEHLQVRMRRRRVEIIINLLHVLAVIAFAVGQAEKAAPSKSDRARSKRQRQTQAAADHRSMPAIPSSPQRYARLRAWSCGKYSHAEPSGE